MFAKLFIIDLLMHSDINEILKFNIEHEIFMFGAK